MENKLKGNIFVHNGKLSELIHLLEVNNVISYSNKNNISLYKDYIKTHCKHSVLSYYVYGLKEEMLFDSLMKYYRRKLDSLTAIRKSLLRISINNFNNFH